MARLHLSNTLRDAMVERNRSVDWAWQRDTRFASPVCLSASSLGEAESIAVNLRGNLVEVARTEQLRFGRVHRELQTSLTMIGHIIELLARDSVLLSLPWSGTEY